MSDQRGTNMKYSIIRAKQFGSRLPKCSSQVSDDLLVITQNLMDTCRKEYSFSLIARWVTTNILYNICLKMFLMNNNTTNTQQLQSYQEPYM